MDIFDETILEFWKYLEKNQVRYLLVGGYAINLHGFQRFTGDMDLWLEDTINNRKHFRKALSDANMGDYPMIETMQFVTGWTEFHLNNGLRLDVMTALKGLERYTFDDCLQMASLAEIEGVQVPFLHLNQLIEAKRTVNRPKDQIDIIALEEIKKLRENEN